MKTILDCIGNTSLLPLRHLGPKNGTRILLKIESENPTGSMKDRMALAMIEAAEADGRLKPGGAVVEGTCDEPGRLASWICLDAEGPRSLTLAARLSTLDGPAVFAERLPKRLIHHNVPGHPVHDLLRALGAGWAAAAPYATFGVRQRWIHTIESIRTAGWPVLDTPARWRLGEVTVAWSAVS